MSTRNFSHLNTLNKHGTLSAYALACGYVETFPCKNNSSMVVSMYREHNDYHVRMHGTNSVGDKFVGLWLSFDNLKEARQQFKKLLNNY